MRLIGRPAPRSPLRDGKVLRHNRAPQLGVLASPPASRPPRSLQSRSAALWSHRSRLRHTTNKAHRRTDKTLFRPTAFGMVSQAIRPSTLGFSGTSIRNQCGILIQELIACAYLVLYLVLSPGVIDAAMESVLLSAGTPIR